MANFIESYRPNLDQIAELARNTTPKILSKEEYDEVLAKHGLYRGTNLSDEGILRAMEAGLIKLIDGGDGSFNLLEQIQSCDIDLRLGHDFWHYNSRSKVPHIVLGKHQKVVQEMLEYECLKEGECYSITASDLVLATTDEMMVLSNVVMARFDGKSSSGRVGVSNHQTATLFHPGFSGQLMMELSNATPIPVGVEVHRPVVSMTFHLLDMPSTRPRNQKRDGYLTSVMQTAPFGTWKEEWVQRRISVLGETDLSRFSIEKNGNSKVDLPPLVTIGV